MRRRWPLMRGARAGAGRRGRSPRPRLRPRAACRAQSARGGARRRPRRRGGDPAPPCRSRDGTPGSPGAPASRGVELEDGAPSVRCPHREAARHEPAGEVALDLEPPYQPVVLDASGKLIEPVPPGAAEVTGDEAFEITGVDRSGQPPDHRQSRSRMTPHGAVEAVTAPVMHERRWRGPARLLDSSR